MVSNRIDAQMLAKMFLLGAKNLEHKKEWINELNVFPVPDGDTGTNMSLTIMSASREVLALEEVTIEKLSKAISMGSLRGARGNSGVILSQLFRGFTKSIKKCEDLTIIELAAACKVAVEIAYKAVMAPKEGTILTVARGASDKINELAEAGIEDLDIVFKEVVEHTEYVLSQTPELLPVLKQAGVVDSGGQGLLEFLKGAYEAYQGKDIDFSKEFDVAAMMAKDSAEEVIELEYEYNIRFNVLLEAKLVEKQVEVIEKYLESIGVDISFNIDDTKATIEMKTNDPGLVLQKGIKYGKTYNVVITNLALEDNKKIEEKCEEIEVVTEPVELKDMGFVAVSIGEGMNDIFRQLGVDYIIEGGQTMNPSTEDILNAVEKVNAKSVFVLPNNKNIILAANQAASLIEDKNVVVIPSKTVPQGLAAVISYMPDISAKENEDTMLEEVKRIKSGQITYAVRDTVIDDKEIKENDFMGIGDSGILSVGQDLESVMIELIKNMITDDDELISIYYGSDVKEDDANALVAKLNDVFDSCDVELQYGGQPVYYYVLSVE